MAETQAEQHKSILVVADNRFLLELVSTNLATLNVELLLHDCLNPADLARHVSAPDLGVGLIILALSHTTNEPVVILAQAQLTSLIGCIPLLIISDRIFAADPTRKIYHLPFPFRAYALQSAVDQLLGHLPDRHDPKP